MIPDLIPESLYRDHLESALRQGRLRAEAHAYHQLKVGTIAMIASILLDSIPLTNILLLYLLNITSFLLAVFGLYRFYIGSKILEHTSNISDGVAIVSTVVLAVLSLILIGVLIPFAIIVLGIPLLIVYIIAIIYYTYMFLGSLAEKTNDSAARKAFKAAQYLVVISSIVNTIISLYIIANSSLRDLILGTAGEHYMLEAAGTLLGITPLALLAIAAGREEKNMLVKASSRGEPPARPAPGSRTPIHGP